MWLRFSQYGRTATTDGQGRLDELFAAPGEAGYVLASHQTMRPCCFDDESEEELAPTGL